MAEEKNGCICMSAINNSSWRKIRNEPKINRIEGSTRHEHSNHLQPTLDERRCFEVRIRSFFVTRIYRNGRMETDQPKRPTTARMQLISCRHPTSIKSIFLGQFALNSERNALIRLWTMDFHSILFAWAIQRGDSVSSVLGHACVFHETR